MLNKPIEKIDNSELEQDAINQFYEQFDITENVNKVSQDKTIKENVIKSNNTIDYFAVIKIPSINLEKGLFNPNSYLNNVKYGIEILNQTDIPFTSGNIYLAAHAGNSNKSYFRNLSNINLEDDVILYYDNQIYKYKVINKYEITKTGKAVLKTNSRSNILVLVSCIHNTNKQIVVICELI